jgi:hypothetical protein
VDTKSQPEELVAPVERTISTSTSHREEEAAVSEPPPQAATQIAETQPPSPSE